MEVDAETLFPVPQYQYYAFIDEPADAGDTRLYFEASRVNPVVGQYIAIIPNEEHDERAPVLATVTAVYADGCDVLPLESDIDMTFNVSPVLFSRMSDNGATASSPVHAYTTYNFIAAVRNLDFLSPLNDVVLPTIKGLPLLRKYISGDDEIQETYLTGVQALDNGRADPVLFKMEGTRRQLELQFIANREGDVSAMHYWRRFADTVKGSQGAWGLSTFRPDAYPAEDVQGGELLIDLLGRAFYDVFRQGGYLGLALGRTRHSSIEYVGVSGVALVDGNTRCLLDTPIVGQGYTVVSFVMRMRLSSDVFTLTHDDAKTIFQFTAQMVTA